MPQGNIKFNEAEFRRLVDAERVLSSLLERFPQAEACGVDCTTFREGAKAMAGYLAEIKKNFMQEFSVPTAG